VDPRNDPRFIDRSGHRYGRLTVIQLINPVKRLWLCRCDCTKTTIVRGRNLISGNTQSCGCWRRESAQKVGKIKTHGRSYGRTYKTWTHMLDRCYNPNNDAWKYYGGRGIIVCRRWHKFENFLADMGTRPRGRSLDRYPDKDGDYKLSNCRWATPRQQNNNKRRWYKRRLT
jgi:hypothetical protein